MANKTIKQLPTEFTELAADDRFIVQRDSDSETGQVRASNVFGGGWIPMANTPNTITNNGQQSYDLVFNSVDLTSFLTPGMRLRTTRTVAAPNQCSDLESSSSQYASKTSPTGISFTDDFTCMGWVKPESYTGSDMAIISRYNGSTSGWILYVDGYGRVNLFANNAGSASSIISYGSVPLDKWSHIAVTCDLSGASFAIYINGISVPLARTGANTAVTQAGNLQVGAYNSTFFFDGKLAQLAVFSSVLSQATIRSYMSQGLAGSESTCVACFPLNGNFNDANSNANHLTAAGSAVATNADSPFGGQNDRTISTTLDYAIVTRVSFSTNTTVTVQVPDGCTIPTSGGVSAMSYSTQRIPYKFPNSRSRWRFYSYAKAPIDGSGSLDTWGGGGNMAVLIPIGSWHVDYSLHQYSDQGTASNVLRVHRMTLSTSNNSESDPYWTSVHGGQIAASNPLFWSTHHREGYIDLSAATTYYAVFKDSGSGSLANHALGGHPTVAPNNASYIGIECAYL